jgi:hypothetical protein
MPGWLAWTPDSEDPAAILARLGIRHFDDDLLTMPIEQLRAEFGYATTDSLHITLFFRNVIWQLYEEIQAGNPPDFYNKHGFVRGMWYHIKGRITRYKELRGHYYGTMDTVLAELVKAGLVSYRDFNFRDDSQHQRILGTENPHIIVFCEKDGFISIMETIAQTYGCTVVSLGGDPSFLSSNYMVNEMAEAGFAMDQPYYCFSIVDFDPAGDINARTFINQLDTSGLRNFHMFDQYEGKYPRLDLARPSNLTGVDIDDVKYVLPAKVQRAAGTLDWARRTGGVDGKGSHKYGLESDEFTEERLLAMVDAAIVPYLVTGQEVVKRRNTMRKLGAIVTDFMVRKILHPTPAPGPAPQPTPPPAPPEPTPPAHPVPAPTP